MAPLAGVRAGPDDPGAGKQGCLDPCGQAGIAGMGSHVYISMTNMPWCHTSIYLFFYYAKNATDNIG